MSTTHTTTAEQLLALPRGEWRYELIHGEVRRMSPAGFDHGRTAMKIGRMLAVHVAEHGLGEVFAAETGFLLARDPDHVRAADASFVRRDRYEAVAGKSGYFPGPPDLAIEVVSPGDTYHEVEEKVDDWLRHGTQVVIVVDPRLRRITLHGAAGQPQIFREGETFDGAPVLPQWRVAVAEIFA